MMPGGYDAFRAGGGAAGSPGMNRRRRLSYVPVFIFILVFPLLLLQSGCRSAGEGGFKTEHIALDVESPEKTADWWCENLGFRIAAKQTAPPYAVFIRQADGQFALELYRAGNTPAAPDYAARSPEQFHIAFISGDIDSDIARLAEKGATLVSRISNNGSELAMLRDPSGIPIQLVRRSRPVLKEE